MKARTAKLPIVTIILAILVLMLVLLVSCQEEAKFLSTSDIKGYSEAINDGALSIEWLNEEFDGNKPTAIFFHGENEENFTINLDKAVYNSSVTDYDEIVNASTIGWRAKGLVDTQDTKFYDMTDYWLKVGEYNVAIIHTEKFYLGESNDDIVTKILSTYKSRYLNNGNVKQIDFNYPLTEVVSAMLVEELSKYSPSREIRFISNGVGSILATAVADYLYTNCSLISNGEFLMPSRLTLCDAYLSSANLDFSIPFNDSIDTQNGTLGVVNALINRLNSTPIAVEMIDAEEVNGKQRRYLANRTFDSEIFSAMQQNLAYLTLSQSYTLNQSFANYLSKSRVALDFYIYSVIGSDDSFDRSTTTDEYAVGYPHSYKDHLNNHSNNGTNWGKNHTRPILNDRAISNDYNETAGATRGFSYGLGAWTPTIYVKTLKGMQFTQKRKTIPTKDSDVNGTVIFNYEDYVLPTFRSENYQYASFQGKTLVCGYIYVDKNTDDYLTDGVYSGIKNARMFATVEIVDGPVIIERTEFFADENGFYTIVLNDNSTVTEEQKLTLTQKDVGLEINGYCGIAGDIRITLQFMAKGYLSQNRPVRGLFHDSLCIGNNFTFDTDEIIIDSNGTHRAIISNCLINEEIREE